MYPADHPPPHFHVVLNDGREALVEIEGLALLPCKLKLREIDDALAWADQNLALLKREWKRLNP
ncbi:DUF4160 domain-containing protein [Pseudomonas sp. C11]|uniref:DUF4160 domain-containing protein n=1 Tax=Pseudomonas sp. C11 TaxID=3075550 RepID=UPI003A52100B